MSFAITIAAQSNVHSISLVDLGDSPYISTDGDKKNFTMPSVVPSRADGKSGIFLARELKFDNQTYVNALRKLSTVQVDFIVQKQGDGKLVAWDMQGKIRAISNNEVSPKILGELKVGQPMVKLVQPAGKMPLSRPDFVIDINSTSRANVSDNNLTIEAWGNIGEPNSPYADVTFSVSGKQTVGEIAPLLGSKGSVDGVNFEVVSADKSKNNWDQLRVIQLSKSSRGSYFLTPSVDLPRLNKEEPSIQSNISTSCFVPSVYGKDVPSGGSELMVSGSVPIKYWDKLLVVRHTSLLGFIGHIPTAPNSGQ